MTEEGIQSSTENQSGETQKVQHVFYEVGGELLDKANLLCDLLEIEAAATAVVFCKSLSDSDLVEVVLNKRAIPVHKLSDDFHSSSRVQRLKQIQASGASVLVATDECLDDINLGDFALIINYSIPEEPEVYLHRTTLEEPSENLKKVISLVSPIDSGNFGFIQKVLQIEFTQGEAPPKSSIYASKVGRIAEKAVIKNLLNDEGIKAATNAILEHPEKGQIVAFLLHNTLVE
ncbi:MAG: DEAD/DEAH box helicase, partial [Bdellovibrionales bacterium]|nr:DEAD/DEAH box helicase [Bdellovibrionales bacterium]